MVPVLVLPEELIRLASFGSCCVELRVAAQRRARRVVLRDYPGDVFRAIVDVALTRMRVDTAEINAFSVENSAKFNWSL